MKRIRIALHAEYDLLPKECTATSSATPEEGLAAARAYLQEYGQVAFIRDWNLNEDLLVTMEIVE